MRRTLRLLILWLCMAALPLQGLAAAAMLHCQHGHGPAPALVADITPDSAALRDDCDGQQGHAPAHEASAPGACSACAACCAAWAVWPVLPTLASAMAGQAHFMPLSAGAEAFVTGGPERPPRSRA